MFTVFMHSYYATISVDNGTAIINDNAAFVHALKECEGNNYTCDSTAFESLMAWTSHRLSQEHRSFHCLFQYATLKHQARTTRANEPILCSSMFCGAVAVAVAAVKHCLKAKKALSSNLYPNLFANANTRREMYRQTGRQTDRQTDRQALCIVTRWKESEDVWCLTRSVY